MLIRYFVIGVSAAVIDVLIFVYLQQWLNFSYYSATTISIALATVYAFSLNAFFNFKVKDRLISRLAMYSFTSLIGWFISLGFLFVFAKQIGLDSTSVKIVSLPVVFIVQYLCNKRFAFKSSAVVEPEVPVSQTENKTSVKPSRYAIIGGGFTGLAAAYELIKAGHKVTIFEFNDHLGGLASGFDLDGYPIERAYHFIYQTDDDTINLLEELDIKDKVSFYPSSIKYFYEGTHYDFMTPLDLLKFTPISLLSRVRLGVFALYLKMVKNWRPLSEVTAMDWLTKYMGPQATAEVWEPLLRGKFDRYYDKITMSWLWGRFSIRARSQDKDLGGEKLGYPVGGFKIIVDALIEKISLGGGVARLQTGISNITSSDMGVTIKTFDGNEEQFDGVIATVPSPIFANMVEADQNVTPGYLAKLKSIDYLDAVVMVFRTTQRLTDTFWYNIKDARVKFLTMLSTSALAGTEKFGGSELYYVGAYVPREHEYMTDGYDIETEWKDGIRAMFPDFDETQIQSLKISKFKDAQHIVDIGYEESKLVPFKTPVPGVYLANFSQIYPDDRGTNFAIRDGREVAAELQKHSFNE